MLYFHGSSSCSHSINVDTAKQSILKINSSHAVRFIFVLSPSSNNLAHELPFQEISEIGWIFHFQAKSMKRYNDRMIGRLLQCHFSRIIVKFERQTKDQSCRLCRLFSTTQLQLCSLATNCHLYQASAIATEKADTISCKAYNGL